MRLTGVALYAKAATGRRECHSACRAAPIADITPLR